MDEETRLRKLELIVAENTATMRAYMRMAERRERAQEQINAKLFELAARNNEVVHGRGEAPGLKGRLDRVEQRHKIVAFIAGSAFVAWVARVIEWAASNMK
jgi:hypothetical protein